VLAIASAVTSLKGGRMKIAELMTLDVEVIRPNDTLRTAAKMMADLDAGILPVGENDRLVGMITDRDITVRAVAEGRDPDKTTVRDTMTDEVRYCFADESPEEVARKMSAWQVRRLPVLSRDKRFVGIVALGDLVIGAEDPAKEALREISNG
jgi:CBS domain-containing protein